MDLQYVVQVTGLEETQAAAASAARSAGQASVALGAARAQSGSALPAMMMTLRTVNATRLAVSQTAAAVRDLNPTAMMYGFLNMMQVVNNLTSLTRMLKDSTGAAASAQAVLAALTGQWWLIPLALAAGALVYSRVKSMQTGGPVTYTGLHMLHRGEYVVPAHQTLGPIFITFEKQPGSPLMRDEWLHGLEPVLLERIRRGS